MASFGLPIPQSEVIHCSVYRADLRKEAVPTEEGVKVNQMHLNHPPAIRRWTLNVTEKALLSAHTVDRSEHIVLVTDDGMGYSAPVCRRLQALGMRPVLLSPEALGADEASIEAAVALAEASGRVMGLIHLAALSELPSMLDAGTQEARTALDHSTRLLFLLCRRLVPVLNQNGILVSVTCMGGDFGISSGEELALSGGSVSGLTKSIAREFPQSFVKLIDISRDATPDTLARWIEDELACSDPALEVGYREGRRLVPVLEAHPLDLSAPPVCTLGPKSVVVITGGARGIGGAVARTLADAHRCTLILLGSTSIHPDAHDWDAMIWDDDADQGRQTLRARLTRELKASQPSAAVREVEAYLAPYLHSLEIIGTLRALEIRGARAFYQPCDVRNGNETERTFDAIADTHGRIDVVLHAAGIAADKALANKTLDSFNQVFDLKVEGTLNVWSAVRKLKPGFFGLFSSVSGRFGNPGQADYSAANEAQSKLARAFSARQPETRTVAFGWGAWSEVGIAARMGVAETMQKNGRTPISPAEGGECVLRELSFGGSHPEIFLAELTLGMVRGLEVRDASTSHTEGRARITKSLL